jgi:hypothetical protein
MSRREQLERLDDTLASIYDTIFEECEDPDHVCAEFLLANGLILDSLHLHRTASKWRKVMTPEIEEI